MIICFIFRLYVSIRKSRLLIAESETLGGIQGRALLILKSGVVVLILIFRIKAKKLGLIEMVRK